MDDEELVKLEEWRRAYVEARKKKFEARIRTQWVEKGDKRVPIKRTACFDAHSLADELKKYVKKSGLKQAEKHQNIREFWYTVVGPEIGDVTTPVRFQNGVLTVKVYSPALRQELENFYKEELLSDLRKALGEKPLRDIRFELAAGTKE
jgi:predicted nucleic acid-binding Zn ribbon protein